MAAMQKLLGFSDKFTDPHFASSYIFELRQHKVSHECFVRILHKNDLYPFEQIKFNPVKIAGILLLINILAYLVLI
jgi:hypothetical protein